MTKNADPLSLPEWKAIHREALLVSQIIGAGVTSIGRADYASGMGEYYSAFFGLSIGIERLAKLIVVADYAIEHAGVLPKQNGIRKFGHNLVELYGNIDSILDKYGLILNYPKPEDKICWRIIDCLESFASASQGRYANFEAIGNPGFDPKIEPVNKWWIEVIEPILDKHYRGTRAEAKAKIFASHFSSSMAGFVTVFHINENGQLMTDLQVSSERTGQNRLAQKFGRYYTLCIVRWLAEIFSTLSRFATHDKNINAFFGHCEIFDLYCLPDSFLLNRKIWPPR